LADRKLKIAFIGTKGVPAKWGGIEKYIEKVGQRLAERGHEVTVFASKWYCAGYKESVYAGMHIFRVPSLRFQATDALTNGFWASKAIITGPFEIAHFHGLASYLYVPVVKRAGKLTVTTTHAMESNWENKKYNLLGRWVIKRAFKLGVKHAHATTTVAGHLKDKIRRKFDTDPVLLPSGLEQMHWHPPQIIKNKYDLHGDDFLLFLGRIDPIKRIDWVLDLARRVDANIRLVVAGGAQDSKTEAYLQSLKQKAGNDPNVIFTGPVAGQEKAELFGNCLIFLAPSADEGLPITVLEAAAYAKCCIVSDLPAFQAVIENRQTGFLFPKNNRESFIATVQQLIHSPEQLIRVGEAARNRLAPQFSWDRTAKRTEELYYQLFETERLNSNRRSSLGDRETKNG
jgi:glycosyltransferase involved in cell wall biosynthesis